jgi:predicted nucleic acid-binding protein
VHLLDTNVVIHLRDGDREVERRVAALEDSLAISVITRVELEGGASGADADSLARRARLDTMLTSLTALPFDDACADRYRAIIKAAGFSRRRIIDRMIAAQALQLDATLVTVNGDDFRDVPGLKLLVW